MDKTQAQMELRLSQLLAMKKSQDMTLTTSGELDAIRNYGLKGWSEYCKKHYKIRRGR
jgi:hypothetical protein